MRRDVVNFIVNKYVNHVVTLQLEEPVAEPASEADLLRVRSDAQEMLGVELDPSYLYLASRSDGIGASGNRIYSTARRRVQISDTGEVRYRDWIIQENLRHRKFGVGSRGLDSDPNRWLIYGAGELAFIIQHLPSRRFQLRPRDDTDYAYRDFATFEELLWDVFRYPLELGDFPADRASAG